MEIDASFSLISSVTLWASIFRNKKRLERKF